MRVAGVRHTTVSKVRVAYEPVTSTKRQGVPHQPVRNTAKNWKTHEIQTYIINSGWIRP